MGKHLQFLSGGGEMGELTRSYDWSSNQLGNPEHWPQSLRTTLSILLNSRFPMVLMWGKDLIQFYNDAYRPSLGNGGNHPKALGQKAKVSYEEFWSNIQPVIDEVFAGGPPTWSEDQMLPIFRNGKVEDAYWTSSYSPVTIETGEIGGILVTLIETTEKVNTLQKLKENKEQLDFAIEAAELGTWDYDPITNKFLGSNRINDWFGFPYDEEIHNSSRMDVIIEKDRGRVMAALEKVLQYDSGGNFEIEYGIRNSKTHQERTVRSKGKVLFGEDKMPYRFNGTLQDITAEVLAKKKVEETEKRVNEERQVLYNSFMNAPAGIAIIKGENHVYEFVNAEYERLVDRKIKLGNTVRDHFPEVEQQGLLQVMDNIYASGETFIANEFPIELINRSTGELELHYYNSVAQPIKDANGKTERVLSHGVEVTQLVEARKQIEANEIRTSNILSQSIMAIGIFEEPDMIIRFANESLLDMWGKGKEIIGKKLMDALPEIKDQGFMELLTEVYTTGISYEALETKAVLIKNGKPVDAYFNFIYQAIFNNDKDITGITIFATDVTEQVLTKKQIEASEKQFSRIIHQSPFAFAILKGRDLVISLANDTIKQIWGKGKDVEGTPLFELLPELQNTVFPQLFEEVFETGLPHQENEILAQIEHNGEMKDMYFNLVYQPYYEAGDTVVGATIIAVEVTAQVVAKKQMQESENQFRIFADSIQNLAWIANKDGWISWYNQQWYDYTGTDFEEMEGWGWEKVHHKDHKDTVIDFVKKAWYKDEPFELTFPLRRYDGEYRWFLTRAYPVKDTNGNIERWIGTNTDIHDQKIKDQQKDDFISIASHEMKTPLTTAKGYIQLLLLSLSEENQTALYAKKANQAVERLHDLVTELLDASKIQNGQLNYTISSFDFNELVDETIENFQHSAKNHVLQKTGKSLQPIKGDRERLQQVLINLLSNAVKYSPSADKVLIKIEDLEDTIQVSVQDFGVGMSATHLNKIFERYYRVEEHAVHFQGLGIGLYICKNILERHDGTMWAESIVGEGSTFYFSLPKTQN